MMKRKRSETAWFYAFFSPWVVGFLCFTLIPMAVSLYYSFFHIYVYNLNFVEPTFVGLKNFAHLFTDELFLKSVGNTFYYTVIRVPVGILAALLVALLLNTNLHGKRVFRSLIYLPAILPVVGSAIVWKQLFSNDFSLLNYLLGGLGFAPIQWSSYENAMNSVLLMSILCGIGPTMIMLLAALQNVPESLMEAADLDGAGPLSKFGNIIVPMISPTLFYLLITGIIGALQAYAEMQLLSMPGDSAITMTMMVVSNLYRMDGLGLGYSAAMSWLIFLIVAVFTALFFVVSRKMVYYEAGDK